MSPGPTQSTPAELSLVRLKNCLVNLPPSLVNLLVTLNAPAQNIVVELSFRPPSNPSHSSSPAKPSRSIFVGWTGLPSRRKTASASARAGINGSKASYASRDSDSGLVEIDSTLARNLGLSDGQSALVSIHVEPPLVHTVNIEPLTAEDWELLELHAQFLELNLLAQVRAVPNPGFKGPGGASSPHELTIHLTPTSTANVKVVSIQPALAPDLPFAKISPNSEVIVAPKTRAQAGRTAGDGHSVASTRRSGSSTVRRRSNRDSQKKSLFFRGIDRRLCSDWFEDDEIPHDLTVWIDRDCLLSKELNGISYVAICPLRSTGSLAPQRDRQQPSSASSTVVAKVLPWDFAPNGQHVALSPPLCATFGLEGDVGGIFKVRAAPEPLIPRVVSRLLVYPFAASSKTADGLKFGGETKAEKDEATKMFRHMYLRSGASENIMIGPLTDGMVLTPFDGLDAPQGWEGCVVRLDYDDDLPSQESSDEIARWMANTNANIPIEFQPASSPPSWLAKSDIFDRRPSHDARLAGIDDPLRELKAHILRQSSTLLTGAAGSGKTSVAKYTAQLLREQHMYSTFYLDCGKLSGDEMTTPKVKDAMMKLVMAADWNARLGGKSLIIIDGLDKLCQVETELQVGNENSRSRLTSEIICSVVRQYCSRESGTVLLATAESKASLNNLVISGHIVRDTVELKAPTRESRALILESIVQEEAVRPEPASASTPGSSRPTTSDGRSNTEDGVAWMDGDSKGSAKGFSGGGFDLAPDLDFLDVAASTDGYMAGDLKVLVSRAQNEAILRALDEELPHSRTNTTSLSGVDFDKALKGFTPASLRNVTLQTSKTTFDSIGGLAETRRILLETLEYPTKYAPIFAKCPLRLRSGLLLYGYPGCGKTLLANAVAGECGLNFISVKGPEILNKYIGASEKSVRDLFDRAQAAKPCVLLFDEFDSIAPKRGHDSTGVTDRVVNQLLVQMDGAEGLSGVYVLAATSRPDLIDPALLRPGRLDKSILCDLPNLEDRAQILGALTRQLRLSEQTADADDRLLELARQTEGFSGADLQAVVSNAQLAAIRTVLESESLDRGPRKANEKGANGLSPVSTFVQFQYGQAGSHDANQKPSASERAEILAKLGALKTEKKRAREAQMGRQHHRDKGNVEAESQEVLVRWEHLVEGLAETKPSMSEQERNRLRRIYREFVTGRSGELHDGQGSMEIGGRSSLM